MPWVVTSWRTERLEALLDARAHEAATAIVAEAERRARRTTRTAARETADAVAYLEILERLGQETLGAVRAQRRAPTTDEAEPVAVRAPAQEEPQPVAVPDPPAAEIRVKARTGRASLRESPLAELFRATVPSR